MESGLANVVVFYVNLEIVLASPCDDHRHGDDHVICKDMYVNMVYEQETNTTKWKTPETLVIVRINANGAESAGNLVQIPGQDWIYM